MRVAAVHRLAHQLVNLLLAAACLVSAWAVATGADLVAIAVGTVCLFTGATVLMQLRSSKVDKLLGRWNEQEYVLMSIIEARTRGMDLEDWLDTYLERSAMDRL